MLDNLLQHTESRLYIESGFVIVKMARKYDKLAVRLRSNPKVMFYFETCGDGYYLSVDRLFLRSRRQNAFDLFWDDGRKLVRAKIRDIDCRRSLGTSLDIIPYATVEGNASISTIQKTIDRPLSISIFVSQINAPGGKTSAMFQLADVLTKAGYDVTVCSFWLVPDGPIFYLPDNVRLSYINSYMENPRDFSRFRLSQVNKTSSKHVLENICNYLKGVESDFVYLPNYDGDIYALFKEYLPSSVCYIVGDHNGVRYAKGLKMGSLPAGSENAKKFVEAINFCDVVHLVNPYLFDLYHKSTKAQIIALPNSIEPKEKGSFLGKKKIIAAGRMVPEKGHYELIEAFKIASERVTGWFLEIYGSGPERGIIDDAASVCSNIKIMNPVSDLDARMRDCAIHATASVVESFGLTIAEAMDIGIPVISREHAGAKLLLGDDRGVICGPSIDELANALSDMMESIDKGDPSGKIKLMTERASAYITSFFSQPLQRQWRDYLSLAYDIKNSDCTDF